MCVSVCLSVMVGIHRQSLFFFAFCSKQMLFCFVLRLGKKKSNTSRHCRKTFAIDGKNNVFFRNFRSTKVVWIPPFFCNVCFVLTFCKKKATQAGIVESLLLQMERTMYFFRNFRSTKVVWIPHFVFFAFAFCLSWHQKNISRRVSVSFWKNNTVHSRMSFARRKVLFQKFPKHESELNLSHFLGLLLFVCR